MSARAVHWRERPHHSPLARLRERGWGRGASASTRSRGYKAVSSACRRPSHFSLRGQRKVTQREATPMARPPGILPCGCAGGLRGFSAALPVPSKNWPASLPAILRTFPPPTRRAIGAPGRAARSKHALFKRAKAPQVCNASAFALASGAHDARPLFMGPLGDGEAWTIRPRSGHRHGRRCLFDRTGVRPKSPATTHGLAGQDARQASPRGALSLWFLSLWARKEKGTRPPAGGRNRSESRDGAQP